MARLLLLILISFSAQAQHGRYHIEQSEGYVTITPAYIRIEEDSSITTLPVIDTGNDGDNTFYILEGCTEGT